MEESSFYCANHKGCLQNVATSRVENPEVFLLEKATCCVSCMVILESLSLLSPFQSSGTCRADDSEQTLTM